MDIRPRNTKVRNVSKASRKAPAKPVDNYLIKAKKALKKPIKSLRSQLGRLNKKTKSSILNVDPSSKITAAFLISILVIASIYDITNLLNSNAPRYEISARAETVLLDPEDIFADELKSTSGPNAYVYNEDFVPADFDLGFGFSEPQFIAEFKRDPSEGFNVTDPATNASIGLKPLFDLGEPSKDVNRVVYPLVGTNGFKVLTLNASEIKEDIVLEEFGEDEMSFSYQLEIPSGMEARLENDGSLGFYGVDSRLLGNVSASTDEDAELLEKARANGEKNQLLFRSPVPVVIEEGRRLSSAEAWYSLEDDVLTLHASGLEEANYPLSIDPSIYVETARKLMRGNNETNVDFDISNELIKKSFTTGARFNSWNSTMDLNDGRWNGGTAVGGGFIYAVGGEKVDTTTVTYSTAGSDTFSVPAGVTEITVKMWGGGGGGAGAGTAANDGDGGAGGGGGFAQATLSVTPLDTLDVYVGAGGGAGDFSTGTAGSNSGDGGGGGGRSYVEDSGTPLIIAGGGGGGGGGDNSSSTAGGAGGAGGGTSGVAGSASSSAPGGGGGTSSAGGAGGNGSENDGDAGGSEFGGDGADGATNNSGTDGSKANGGNPNGGPGGNGDQDDNGFGGGGGGGDGYYGGGGGSSSIASNAGGGGGGGGSGYVTGTATTLTAGSGTVPGNDSDSDRSGAGDGGAGGSAPQGSGTAGDAGRVVISYSSGTGSGPRADVYWAQLSTTNNSIESPNPGAGTCTEWCTNSAYDLPDERAGFSLVAYNGFLYAIGGVDDTGTRQNTVYISKLGVNGEPSLWHPTDDDQDNWVYWYASSNTLTNATSYGAAVAYRNSLYYLGGQTNASTGGVTTVYKADFDPTGDIESWSTTGMTVLPSARHMHTVHTYNDYMYLIGGNSSGTLQNSVHYTKIDDDGTLNVWTSTESFDTARSTWGGNNTLIWGGFVYLAGGCSAVNGSGYCTTIRSDVQLASINSDGTLDTWRDISNVTNQRIGYGFLAWDNGIYRIGGCSAQNATNGECSTLTNSEDYGTINPAGEVSTITITETSGTAPCSGANPENCDLPPVGDDAGEGGQLLTMSTILNGHLYVIGGCTDYTCEGTTPGGDDADISGNISYVSIANDGSMEAPSYCPGTSYGAWCVDSTNRINGTTGIAAGGITVFNNTIYVVGGLEGGSTSDDMSEDIFYNTVNEDGSLSGSWSSVDMTSIGMSSDVAYTYAYARANPSSAGTTPGHLFIFGGCTAITSGIACSSYGTQVYKCNIGTTGAVSNCSTSGQTQIDSDPDTGGSQGLGIHSGTVYANYIYLIGGYSSTEPDKDEIMIAKFDDNNNVVEQDGSGTSSWSESPNTLSIGRRRGWAFGYNGHIYSVGGYDDGGVGTIPFIEWSKMDVSTGDIDPFITSDVTINQRWGLAVTVSNSYAYVIGGCDVGTSPTGCSSFEPSVQIFQIYNNDSGTAASYSAGANLFSTDRYGASAAMVDGTLYVAGGCTSTATDCTDATDSVQYASIDEEGDIGSWSATIGDLPADRAWGQLEEAGGTLYYIGGQDDTATNEQSTVYYATPALSSGYSSIVQEQTASGNCTGSSSCSPSASITAPEAGNMIIAVCSGRGNPTTYTGVSMTGYTSAAAEQSNSDLGIETFYKVSDGTETTVSCTVSGSASVAGSIAVYEYSGIAQTSPVDVTASNSGNDSTSPTTGTTGTSSQNDVLGIAGIITEQQNTTYSSWTNSFSEDVEVSTSNPGGHGFAAASLIASSTQTFGTGATVSGCTGSAPTPCGDYMANVITFKAEYVAAGDFSAWKTATNGLPAARTQFSSAVWNDRIYVVAGLDGSANETNTVYISPQLSSGGDITSAWTTETDTPDVARSGNTVIAYANNLYSIGGHDGSNYLSDAQFTQINSDGTLDAWTFTTNLPNVLRQADGFASNGYLYLFGGRTADTSCQANTYVTPISANTTIASGNNPTGVGEWYETNENYTGSRYGATAVEHEGKAYVMGGICQTQDFPSVSSVTTSSQNSNSTTHNAAMPATVDSGDLLLTLMTIDDKGGTTITTPTGWSIVQSIYDSGTQRQAVYAKSADGTEDSTNVNFGTSASTQSSQHVYRVPSGEWFGTISTGIEFSTTDTGSTSTPNPPSLNPSNWGTEKTLWIAFVGGRSYGGVTSYPTGYSNGQHTNSGGTSNDDASVSSAELQAEIASEDPGSFTMTTTDQSGSITIGVRPVAAANTLTGANRVVQTALLSQPQVAKYSRLIDTDTDVFPNKFLINGIDNFIGARWEVDYFSSTDATSQWGQVTEFGEVTLGTVNDYTPVDGTGTDTEFARFFYFWIEIDASKTFGYPDDVTRGPTINDITLFFTSDPGKRLRHGKTFTGGEKQPLDTPPP